ncbi:MAG: hypothetical protein Q9179_001199 [Wetmoreana sp. 5 TL-2023]
MVIRVGIIGLSADQSAWATIAHIQPIKEGGPLSQHFKLTALATSNPESAKAAARFHGLPLEKGYSNPEDIANDPDVDLVVVSVKVFMHKQLTIPALNARKDVFVEWPLGNGLAEAEEMAALARKQGVKTYVGLQARVQPAMVKAKEIISSGALGRIISTTILAIESKLLNLPEKGRYVNDPNSGASIISIPFAHTLDVVLHVLSSELTSLTATTHTTYPTVSFVSSSPDGTPSLSAPEPKCYADNIVLAGTLAPSNAALSFHYITTAPVIPALFQWIICGEKGAMKLEAPNPVVQMTTDIKLWFAEAPEEDGVSKDFYGSKEGGAEWREVEIPMSELDGIFGGIAPVYEGIARGWGKSEVSVFLLGGLLVGWSIRVGGLC